MKMKWFDRRFDLGLPAWRLPMIVERLRGTPARLEERLAGVAAERLVARPADGSWTIQQNAGHLLDLEPLWSGRVEDFRDGEETLRVADLTNRRTDEASHDERPIGEILARFRSARAALVAVLEGADGDLLTATALHPRLRQPMGLADHAYFVAEHDDHHLARITELLETSRSG